MEAEGATKFIEDFQKSLPVDINSIKELNAWRKILFIKGLIGCKDKIGYGNVSQRANGKSFIITGSQTGHLEDLTEMHYSTVKEFYPEKNRVVSEGPIRASSESMTHGSIYDIDEFIKFVFHVHSLEIWKYAKSIGIPITKENVEYGTPEMAREVERIFKETDVKDWHIFSMGGHEDGIFSFGKTADIAGYTILYNLERARSIERRLNKPS